jgi:hypothetical protein
MVPALIGAGSALLAVLIGARIQAWYELVRWRRSARMEAYAELVRVTDRAGRSAHIGQEPTGEERVQLMDELTAVLAPISLVAPPEIFEKAADAVTATIMAVSETRGSLTQPDPASLDAWSQAHDASAAFRQAARVDLGIDRQTTLRRRSHRQRALRQPPQRPSPPSA